MHRQNKEQGDVEHRLALISLLSVWVFISCQITFHCCHPFFRGDFPSFLHNLAANYHKAYETSPPPFQTKFFRLTDKIWLDLTGEFGNEVGSFDFVETKVARCILCPSKYERASFVNAPPLRIADSESAH
jgi:hypothetical protein